MTTETLQRIVLTSRPRGKPTPAAFLGMLEGKNFGKTLVRVAEHVASPSGA